MTDRIVATAARQRDPLSVVCEPCRCSRQRERTFTNRPAAALEQTVSSFSTRQDVVDFVDKQVTKRVMDAYKDQERDAKRKVELYDRISRHVGSFDHEGMSLKEMAAHAAKRLSLNLAEGADPVSAIEGYLTGRTHAASGASGMDGAVPSFLDGYLNGAA
jgi:hypothetical protein